MTSPGIEALLPSFMQRAAEQNPELRALLAATASLLAPNEARFAELDAAFDPRRTEVRFVAFLAAWVDLRRVFEVSSAFQPDRGPRASTAGVIGGSLRELAAQAVFLSHWRGTASGLTRFLELATGVRGFSIDDHPVDERGDVRPFHMSVIAPEGARPWTGLIQRIIAMEKPAHMTAQLDWKAGAG